MVADGSTLYLFVFAVFHLEWLILLGNSLAVATGSYWGSKLAYVGSSVNQIFKIFG